MSRVFLSSPYLHNGHHEDTLKTNCPWFAGLKSVSCQGRRSSFQQQHVVSSTPRRFNVRLTAAASDGDAWGTDNSNSNIPGSNTPSSKAPSSKKPSLCGVQEQQEEGEERQLRAIMKWLFGGVGAMDSATVFLSAYTALPIFPLGGLAGYGAMRNACARAVIAAVPAMSGYTLWRFVAYFTTPYNYLKSKGKGIQALIGMLFAVPLVITLFLCMITPFLALLPLWQFLITIY